MVGNILFILAVIIILALFLVCFFGLEDIKEFFYYKIDLEEEIKLIALIDIVKKAGIEESTIEKIPSYFSNLDYYYIFTLKNQFCIESKIDSFYMETPQGQKLNSCNKNYILNSFSYQKFYRNIEKKYKRQEKLRNKDNKKEFKKSLLTESERLKKEFLNQERKE